MGLIGWHAIIVLTFLLLVVAAVLGVVWLVRRGARRSGTDATHQAPNSSSQIEL